MWPLIWKVQKHNNGSTKMVRVDYPRSCDTMSNLGALYIEVRYVLKLVKSAYNCKLSLVLYLIGE